MDSFGLSPSTELSDLREVDCLANLSPLIYLRFGGFWNFSLAAGSSC